MKICRRCGVELEDTTEVCPLCGTSLSSDLKPESPAPPTKPVQRNRVRKKLLLQQILWQITAVMLISCILATLLIDISIHKTISWSIYPVTICLIIFPYASIMAFWHTRIVYQVLSALVIAAGILTLVEILIAADWPLRLALPLLCAVNIVAILLILLLQSNRIRGLAVITAVLISMAILCLMIEGVISLYFERHITLQWSVVVAACLIPVSAVILFMYFRIRNSADLRKIFHT